MAKIDDKKQSVSSSKYPNYHSITFSYASFSNPFTKANVKVGEQSFNTWSTWHLIPTTRPIIVQPTPVYTYVDIPGADGSLDLTDYLIGRPTYSDRSGTFEFYVANIDLSSGGDSWPNRRTQISKVLDGKLMKISLDDDKDYYYVGRCYLKQWTPGPNYSQVTIEYRVEPFKYYKDGTKSGVL